jgi:hypothetical protein
MFPLSYLGSGVLSRKLGLLEVNSNAPIAFELVPIELNVLFTAEPIKETSK